MASRRKRRLPRHTVGIVVLDSGAVTKIAAGGNGPARAVWRQLVERGWLVCIPAVTLAETTTGRARTDVVVDRLVQQVGDTPPCDAPVARHAGQLRARASRTQKRRPSGIDAIVAAVAATRQPSIVITTDGGDLEALLASAPRTRVVVV